MSLKGAKRPTGYTAATAAIQNPIQTRRKRYSQVPGNEDGQSFKAKNERQHQDDHFEHDNGKDPSLAEIIHIASVKGDGEPTK
jgi:hypothetical protein